MRTRHALCRAAIVAAIAATSCSSERAVWDSGDGAPGVQSSDPTSPVPPTLGGDAGPADASAPATPASSLSLEQVWVITGSTTPGKDVFVDFRVTPPAIQCEETPLDGYEGTGVFTAPDTGDLLFFTDGRSVVNGKTKKTLENGSGLTGHASATEPALITPLDKNGAFYIFTNDTNNTTKGSIWYSTIDLNAGPDGTVTEKNQLLSTGNPGEALDVVPHINGKDFWVLTYDGAASIRAYLVGPSGVAKKPVVSETHLTGVVLRGSINHTLDYDHLALGMNFGGPNGLLAIATIDRSTGNVADVTTVTKGDLGYHATFSGDGTKLYYVRGTEGWMGVAHQLDLGTGFETVLGGTNMAAAKLAVDGKIYWASFGASALGVVAHPDAAGTASGFEAKGLDLKGCTTGFGLPNQTAAFLDYLPPAVPR